MDRKRPVSQAYGERGFRWLRDGIRNPDAGDNASLPRLFLPKALERELWGSVLEEWGAVAVLLSR